MLERALERAKAHGYDAHASLILVNVGLFIDDADDPAREAMLRESLELARRVGSSRLEAIASDMLGIVFRERRQLEESIAHHAAVTLHVRLITGRDPHHIVEAQFKALARALRAAVEPDPRVEGIPSTKGAL